MPWVLLKFILVGLLVLACSSSKEQAFREINNLLQKAQTATLACEQAVGKATSDQQAAEALLQFATALQEVKEGFRQVDERYPEIKSEEAMTPAVAESYNQLRELSNRLGEAIQLAQQKYRKSKVFQEAFETMARSVL